MGESERRVVVADVARFLGTTSYFGLTPGLR